MAKLSVAERIKFLKTQKSVADRVYEAIEAFNESEMDEVKRVLVDLFELSASDVAVAEAPVAQKKAFAKPAVVSADAPKRRGPKPKNKVKEEAAAEKSSGRGRSRGPRGKYPTIHAKDIHDAVIAILKDNGGELSQKEIRTFLYEGAYAAHKDNKSFLTRVSSLIGEWCEAGELEQNGRGVYRLVKN